MPLKILYIFLCFVFVHRSLGNNDAEQDIVQSLIANETYLSSIPEISPDKSNVTRRNIGYDRTEYEECEKATTIKKTLKLLISLLSDSGSTNSKTTSVLENLKDLLKNTAAGDVEVLNKIDDLVKTLDKYKEPGERNDLVPSSSLSANPKKDGLKLDSRLKLNLEIPALANIYCTQQLLNILKATEQAYLNLARNPVCEIDVSDLPTIPNINPHLLNPNLQFDDWGKSSNKILSQNCEKCNPVRPGKNIVIPYYYPVFVDVNPDKNPISTHENPDDYDQVQPIIDNPDKNSWPSYYNLGEPVSPINLNPVTVVENPDKNPGTKHYYPEFFGVKPDQNPLLPDYPYYEPIQVQPVNLNPDKNYKPQNPGPNYYPELFSVKPDNNPLLPDYTYYGPVQVPPVDLNPDNNDNPQNPGPNYYPELFSVKPEKKPLLPDYTYYGPVQVQPVNLNPDYNYNPEPNYYPEFFGMKPDKNLVVADYNPYGPGEVSSDKTPVTPYYYPEYIDVNLDKNPLAPYYNPDATPLGPVNPWNKTPFPYDAAPEIPPLNPIFPYTKIPSYPNIDSNNQKIYPFEITEEAVNFVYPNLYAIPIKPKPLNFSENVIEQSFPIYQYPNFPPKEIAPLDPYSLYSKHPEHNYGINPYIANYVKQPPNSVLPYASEIYTKTESTYSENEVPIPQFLPRHNIPVNPWEISNSPNQNQNIPIYPFTYQNVQNNYPIEISPVNPDFVVTDTPEYNIQPINQYPIYPPTQHEISPLNIYSPYVPDQFGPQQSSPNPRPLIDVDSKPFEQIQPLKIIAFVREAIEVIQAVVPVVKFDPPTLHIIAKIKSILVPKDEDIPHEQYSTILDLFGKVIEYVKQLDYYKQIKDIIDSHAVSNRQKLETEKIVELTYLLKQPKPVVYYPYYYVKYSMPYRNFMIVADNLLRQKPELKDKPTELYEELLALSHVVDVSPDLKNYNKDDLLKLTVNAGSLVDTKLIEENHALRKQLNMLKNITSDLTTDEILDLKESNNKYQQFTDMDSDDQESVEPFILRDKKEADPNTIIGMEKLNDLLNSPISHSSTFHSDKLRDDILRDGKDSVNIHLRSAINNKGENNPPANNWIQKLFDATKEASYPPNVMSSNGYVNIDNQKITMNSGSGNRQDSISVFNPKSTTNIASSNSNDIGIDFKSKQKDVNEFSTKYNGPNMINYDNQKIIMASGDSNYQNRVKITNPKLMLNDVNYQESNADDLESATEQDGLTIESNPPLKWEQINTHHKPTPRPESPNNYKTNVAGANQVGVINHNVYDEQHLVMPKKPIPTFGNNVLFYGMNSVPHQVEVVNDNEPLLISNDPAAFPGTVVYYGINGMGMSDHVGGTNHKEQLLISNNPSAVPGSVAYYEINGIGKPNQIGEKKHEEQLLISNNPTAVPGSVAYYKINGMEMPNQVGGIDNEKQLLISNNPTAVPGSVTYYALNGIKVPNLVGGINNEEQVLISNNPTAGPGSAAYYGSNGMGLPNQVGEINNDEQLLNSNNPKAIPGSIANYGINGMGMPNQVGEINNEDQLSISNDPTSGPGSVVYYVNNGIGMPNQVGGINNGEQLLISNDHKAIPGGLLYYGMNSVAANQGGMLGTQSTVLHQEAEQLYPYELEHIIDAEPDNNGINGESFKESVFDDIQLIEKMKYNGNQSVGGGKGVVNNVLQSITGHDHVLQYTVDSQDQLNLNNNGLYTADANQGMIGQQNLENNKYVAVVGQNSYENDLFNQQNLGPISPLGQNIQSTIVHHIATPYNAAHNIIGYGPAGDVLGQKVVIQSVPVIYQRPFSYQRITARRPVVVG